MGWGEGGDKPPVESGGGTYAEAWGGCHGWVSAQGLSYGVERLPIMDDQMPAHDRVRKLGVE